MHLCKVQSLLHQNSTYRVKTKGNTFPKGCIKMEQCSHPKITDSHSVSMPRTCSLSCSITCQRRLSQLLNHMPSMLSQMPSRFSVSCSISMLSQLGNQMLSHPHQLLSHPGNQMLSHPSRLTQPSP